MENTKTWLLIADASKARLFSLHKARIFQDGNPKNMELIGEFTHPESRKKTMDLVTDKMGEFGSGTFAENTPPKVHEAEVFAAELLAHLNSGHQENSFRDLIIIAPPAFMGILNKHMSHQMKKINCQKIEKDYTQHTGKELLDKILAHL